VGVDARARRATTSPVVAAIAKELRDEPLAAVSVRYSDGHVWLGRVPAYALDALASALKRVTLPSEVRQERTTKAAKVATGKTAVGPANGTRGKKAGAKKGRAAKGRGGK
jgi:hypothetical protein